MPALATYTTGMQQDGSGTCNSDWVDKYEFYDIQTTVDEVQSQQKQGNLDNNSIPTSSDTIVEATFVGEKSMPNAQNSFSQKSIPYTEPSSTSNNGKDDFVYLENHRPTIASIENNPTSLLSMIESSKMQRQESENIASTERSTGASTLRDNTSNASRRNSREAVLKEKDSSDTYTNIVSQEKREILLRERLDSLQKDHKEREEEITDEEVCSKELKKNHLDNKIGTMFDNSKEHEDAIKVLSNEREIRITEEIKRRKGKQVTEEIEEKGFEGEEKDAKENDAGEGQKEKSTIEMLQKENKNLSLEQLDNFNRNDGNDQATMSAERPTMSMSLPVKPVAIESDTEEEIETSNNKDKKEKKTRRMLVTAAGVAGGVAGGLTAPVFSTGVVVGVGSALIAKKVGKKIQKEQRKNQDQSLGKLKTIEVY